MIQSQNQSQQSQVTSQQQQQANGQPDCRSEATSVCGDNSSVLSGFSGAVQAGGPGIHGQAGVGPPSSVTSTMTSSSKAAMPSNLANDPLSKRDSLVKEASNIYVDSSGSVGGPQVGSLGSQQGPKVNSVNDDLETSTPSAVTGKEW